MEEDTAFDPSIIMETKMRYRDYILEAARSIPVEIRIATTIGPIADTAAP